MIDQNSRNLLAQRATQRAMQTAMSNNKPDLTVLNGVVDKLSKKQNDSLILDTLEIQTLTKMVSLLGRIAGVLEGKEDSATAQAVASLTEKLSEIKSPKIKIPEFPASISINEASDLLNGIKEVVSAVSSLEIQVPEIQKVEVLNPTKVTTQKVDLNPIIDAIREIQLIVPTQKREKQLDYSSSFDGVIKALEDVKKSVKGIKIVVPETDRKVEVINFPPQKIPQPVTKIDINPLRGDLLSTLTSVGTTATPIPATASAKRRSLIVFNNDSTKTLYLGGSGVTSSGPTTGLPVKPQNYSPPIDAGPQMVLYGVTTTGTIDAICLEANNDYTSPGGNP